MASRRKRSLRGLGGTPQHHASEAKVLRIGATRRFNEAAEKARNKACSAALDRLIDASGTKSQADLHDVEGRSFSLTREGIEAESFAIGAFKANCVMSGGLSGARRRRRK